MKESEYRLCIVSRLMNTCLLSGQCVSKVQSGVAKHGLRRIIARAKYIGDLSVEKTAHFWTKSIEKMTCLLRTKSPKVRIIRVG